MIKILHTGDIHARNDDLEEIKRCLAMVVETSEMELPHLIVIAGDTFDSRDIKLDSPAARLIFEVVGKLGGYGSVLIVLGTPSHDGRAAEALRYVKAKYPVWVSTMPEMVFLNQDGFLVDRCIAPRLVISVVPQPTKQYFQSASDIESSDREIAGAMAGIFGGFGARAAEWNCPHVLVGHFSVGGALLSETQHMLGYDIEMARQHIELANCDLVMLGHIHYPQRMGNRIFYCGSIYRRDFGETEDKGFWLHLLNAHGLQESAFIKTPTRKLYRVQRDFSANQNGFRVDLTPEMLEQIEGAVVRVELKVFEDEVEKIDQEGLKKMLQEAGATDWNLRITRVPRSNVRSENILKLQRLRDKVLESARLKGEEVPESILAKADLLEEGTPEEVVASVARG